LQTVSRKTFSLIFYSTQLRFLTSKEEYMTLPTDRTVFLEETSRKNFEWRYLSNRSSDTLPVWF